jgi:Chromo (CHRromatin Organisation MOdifier) domain
VLHSLVKSSDVAAEFSAAAVLIQCFLEPNSVHFAVALNQCSTALILVLQRDMTKKLPRSEGTKQKITRDRLLRSPAKHDNDNEDETLAYVVDQLISIHKNMNGRCFFRVRWQGYGPEEDTYEPEENLPPHLVLRFYRNRITKTLKTQDFI